MKLQGTFIALLLILSGSQLISACSRYDRAALRSIEYFQDNQGSYLQNLKENSKDEVLSSNAILCLINHGKYGYSKWWLDGNKLYTLDDEITFLREGGKYDIPGVMKGTYKVINKKVIIYSYLYDDKGMPFLTDERIIDFANNTITIQMIDDSIYNTFDFLNTNNKWKRYTKEDGSRWKVKKLNCKLSR